MFEVLAAEPTSDGTLVVRLHGELDLQQEPLLWVALDGLPEHALLVLDLRRLEFIDSSGVRALFLAQEQTTAAGRDYLVVTPRAGSARRVFEILDLDRVAWVVDTLPHAGPAPARRRAAAPAADWSRSLQREGHPG